ncbi:MAG: Gfo/Idh/MocA family oxidoreductase [Bacteroidetes bacterium]|nr:Gfo/Idh/MocA family oxidoreductase [Bacteroidota bacterium]
MLKVGIFGIGHLGKIHLKILSELSKLYEIVGFIDPNNSEAESIQKLYKIPRYHVAQDLIEHCDCIDIVTPTPFHFEIAKEALEAGKAVFIEKPMTDKIDEAETLINLSKEKSGLIQVGHVERFNSAFIESKKYIKQPMFIETHRLGQFNPRGIDVPVILDLMIHDIDIILNVVNSKIQKISATGVSVISDSHDIANARIEFENGCVANLTASRISLKNMRKSRFFQKDAYVSVDFLTKELEVVQLEDFVGSSDDFDIVFDPGNGKVKKRILFNKPNILETNAIKEELISFHSSIVNKTPPVVSGEDGLKSLKIAIMIMESMKKTN